MVTLALDTSHSVGATALARDGAALGEIRFDSPSSHLVELSKAVERLLASNHLAVRDVSRVAVVLGPGSFTGVRIAVAFAKGLAATGRELVGIGALELIARPLLRDGCDTVCAMIDARRGEIYGALYQRAVGHAVGVSNAVEMIAARATSPGALLDSVAKARPTSVPVFAGTGARVHRDAIATRFPGAEIADESRACPSVAYLATIAHHLPALTRDAARTLEPIYLRASGAERTRLRAHAPEAQRDE